MPDHPASDIPPSAVGESCPPMTGKRRQWLMFGLILLSVCWLGYVFIFVNGRPKPPPDAGRPSQRVVSVGDVAPDFTLLESHKSPAPPSITLSERLKDGPMLVIFYPGYQCQRCAEQLKELADARPEFEKAGMRVVAISPDAPLDTQEAIKSYGDAALDLLYDKDDRVAKAYGMVKTSGEHLHGAFIIARDGRITFAERGEHPFTDYELLLATARKLSTK